MNHVWPIYGVDRRHPFERKLVQLPIARVPRLEEKEDSPVIEAQRKVLI